MSDIGKLVVSLEANIARFTTEMSRAASEHEKAMKLIADRSDMANKALRMLGTAAKTIGGALFVGMTFDKFRSEIEKVISSAAGLQDMAERTGATVEGLSAIASAAKLSGTDLETLGGGLQKLAKSMVDAQSGGKTTASAFEAIGISVKDLKGQSPDQVFALVAQRLAEYEDGADKVAVAQALLGKSGANLLPTLKDLAEQGGLQARVTAQQAEMADNYQKTLVRLNSAQSQVFRVIAMEALPVMAAFAEELLKVINKTSGVKDEVTGLARDNTLRTWAQEGALAASALVEVLMLLFRTNMAVAGSFQVVYQDAKLAQTFLFGGKGLNPFSDENKATLKAAADERNQVLEKANKRYEELWNSPKTPFTDALRERFRMMERRPTEDRGFVPDLPNAPRKQKLNFRTAEDDKPKRDEGEAFLEQLQRQVVMQSKGRMEVLRMEAAQKGVADAAERYIVQLENLEGDKYVEDLKRQVDMQTLGGTQLMRQEAAQKGVTDAAEVYIRKLDEIEAQKRILKDLEEQTARIEADRARQGEYQGQGMALVKGVQEQTQALGLDDRQARRQAELRRLDDMQAKALGDASREDAPPGQFQAVLKQFETMRDKLNEAFDELERHQDELSANAGEGFARGMRNWARDVADQAKWAESYFTGAMSKMEDALVEFAKTGKLNFRSLFAFMAEEYLRNVIRMSIKQVAAPGGSFVGWGNMFSTIAGFFGFGSHASGLDYVPHDDYPALLHRGERVQTAVEASAMRNGNGERLHFDFSGQVLNVGQGVSRAEVASALQASQAQTIERIRRLERQGRFA